MKKFGVILLLAALFAGCHPKPHYSEVPYIEFVRLDKVDNGTGKDDQANLVVYFHDGDGDIGLTSSDITGAFPVIPPITTIFSSTIMKNNTVNGFS